MGDAFRVGLGGPVGAGKTSLTASLCRSFQTPYQWLSLQMTYIPKRMLKY